VTSSCHDKQATDYNKRSKGKGKGSHSLKEVEENEAADEAELKRNVNPIQSLLEPQNLHGRMRRTKRKELLYPQGSKNEEKGIMGTVFIAKTIRAIQPHSRASRLRASFAAPPLPSSRPPVYPDSFHQAPGCRCLFLRSRHH